MNYQREIAGVFVGIGAIVLIWKGEVTLAGALLSGMMGFFIGEKNGQRINVSEESA
jgi:hypothetical protein